MGSVPGHQALKQGGPMRLKHSKHIVDVLLGVGLLLLMSYQVTGEAGHE